MSETKKPMQEDIMIEASALLGTMQDLKTSGYRLSQACAANTENGLEIWYSLDDGNYNLKNLLVPVSEDMSLQSITKIYWYAFIYENEMHDLFGVKFKNLELDYNGHFYRVSEATPWNPKASLAESSKGSEKKGGEE